MKSFVIAALVALAAARPGGEWQTWQQPCPTVTDYVTVTDYQTATVTDYVWKTTTVTDYQTSYVTDYVTTTVIEYKPCQTQWQQWNNPKQ